MKAILRSCGVLLLLNVLFVCAATPARAQMFNLHKLNFDFGGGVTPALGTTSSRLGTGWNITGGVGYNFTPRFGGILQVMYDGLPVNKSVIQEFSVPGANSHIWGFTLNPIVRFRTQDRIGFYAIGGGGYYRRVLNMTAPTLQTTLVFDPFFGIVTPITYTANQTIGTITRVGWGENIGAGITYKIRNSRAKLFVEFRYHHIETSPRATNIMPITFGIRW